MQLVTFFVGPYQFGIDVLRVQEVLQMQPVTRIPVAPRVVAGLLNLRGQILTALDLRSFFGMDATDDPSQRMNVILPYREDVVSLVADRVGDVVQVDEDTVEGLPPNTPEVMRPLLRGVVPGEGRLLFVLDADHSLDIMLDQVEVA